MRTKRKLVETIVAWGILVAFMVIFSPNKLPVVMLITPFLLLFFALYYSWSLLAALKDRFYGEGRAAPRRRLGFALCATGVLVVILQSLGQLSLKDIVTLSAIVGLGYFFLTRNRVDSQKR